MLVAFLIGLATEVPLVAAEGPPSATMRFMEQVHGHYRASEDDREAQQLYGELLICICSCSVLFSLPALLEEH